MNPAYPGSESRRYDHKIVGVIEEGQLMEEIYPSVLLILQEPQVIET